MQIEIKNVFKSFGRKSVLEDINLTVSPGEILCLLGPSGAGKTTLIRLINGAIPSDKGIITMDGVRIPDLNLLKCIGFMPQNDALYNDLSGTDNLAFFGSLYGLKGSDLKKKTDEMLALVNLANDAEKLVMNYSGGMKKRLSLAVALIHNPDILLLDEPTVGIDPVLRQTIWDKFQHLKSEGKTLIVTTHVMDEAEKCDRVGLIYDGKLIADGNVKDLKATTKGGTLEELFFQTKEVNSI